MIRSVDAELIFELIRDELGCFSARCLNARIRAEGNDLAELNENLTAAVAAHYPGKEPPDAGAIHLIMFPTA